MELGDVRMKKDKKKHPVLRSLWQIILLIIVLVIVSYFTYALDDVANASAIDFAVVWSYVLLICGFIGSILIIKNNVSGKNYLKIYTIITLIIISIIGISNFSYNMYENIKSNSRICGNDGYLYYCESEKSISCSTGEIAIKSHKGYECVVETEYLMNILGRYDYPCIEKFNKYRDYDKETLLQLKHNFSYDKLEPGTFSLIIVEDENNENINRDLVEEEKACVPSKLDKLYSDMISSRLEGLPSKYDVRDKVSVKPGNQGKSNTCTLWSITKALEISAQLKDIDYKFLSNFESKINSVNIDLGGTLDASLNNRKLIPGNWKLIGDDSDDRDIPYLSYTEEVDNYLAEYRAYYPDDPNKYYDKYLNDVDIVRTKRLVMDYGSAFISSPRDEYNHMMIVIGWDDTKKAWLALNSWGKTWSGYDFISNGDGTTWIKYSDKKWEFGATNSGYAIELISK